MNASKQPAYDRDAVDHTGEALSLYEKYAKPLENSHRGEYIAISRDGRAVLGTDLDELTDRAITELGPGNFIFRVDEIAVGMWLYLIQ